MSGWRKVLANILIGLIAIAFGTGAPLPGHAADCAGASVAVLVTAHHAQVESGQTAGGRGIPAADRSRACRHCAQTPTPEETAERPCEPGHCASAAFVLSAAGRMTRDTSRLTGEPVTRTPLPGVAGLADKPPRSHG